MPRRRKVKGERRHGAGWQVYIRVNGELRWKQFPLESTPEQRHAWRIVQRNKQEPQLPQGALGRDAVSYLRAQKHRPDYVNQEIYIRRWVDRFGKYRIRTSLTSQEIETTLSEWLSDGYSPTTVRHHRTALAKLFRFHDGKRAYNPVDDTTRPRDPEPETRLPNLEHVRQVLVYLPATKTRARLKVLLTTGIPHKQIGELKPEDWDKARRVLYVRRRHKGRGAPGRLLPLSDAGTAALEEFDRAEAWGSFSPSAMYKRVKEACIALGLPMFAPYGLRHVQGTFIYLETGDLSTTARMLGHKGIKTAERYARSAFALVDEAAAAKVGEKLTALLPTPEKSKE